MKEGAQDAWELDRLKFPGPCGLLWPPKLSLPYSLRTSSKPGPGGRRNAPETGGPAPLANRVLHFPGAWVPQGQAESSCCPLAPFCQLFWEDKLMSKSLAFVKYKNTTERSAFDLRSPDRRNTGAGSQISKCAS